MQPSCTSFCVWLLALISGWTPPQVSTTPREVEYCNVQWIRSFHVFSRYHIMKFGSCRPLIFILICFRVSKQNHLKLWFIFPWCLCFQDNCNECSLLEKTLVDMRRFPRYTIQAEIMVKYIVNSLVFSINCQFNRHGGLTLHSVCSSRCFSLSFG